MIPDSFYINNHMTAPLYVRRKRDVIIWFGISKRESIETVNDALLKRGLAPLYKE